jgi:MFS family permease
MATAHRTVNEANHTTGAGRWRALALLSVAELLGMSLWFSASAVVPALQTEWQLSTSGATWLTLAVQLGFVVGTFLSALFNLPDVINARHLVVLCSLAGAAVNAALALFAHDAAVGVPLRFFTGLFMAGVYPPAMKIMATWFRQGRGLAIGVLVGALTVGKAFPYLINGLGSASWRDNLLFVSALAVVGGLIVRWFVSDGPYALPNAKFDIHQIKQVLGTRSVRLANFGYFGHMWELYAMWTWTPVMIRASLAHTGSRPELAEVGSFLVLGAGAAGCVIAGLIADRVGRTIVTSWAMIVSGACCLVIGLLYQSSPWLLLTVAVIWGASVVADSAQFSTCVTELANPQYIGTALTLQTCLGFLLTTLSIELIPILVGKVGWEFAFMALAPGPAFGVFSMLRLRALPDAVKIAGGRR